MAARKILVLSGLQVYPPLSGGTLRTSSLINALVARGFEVTVYSMVGRKQDYLAGKPSGFEIIGNHLREYVDRGRFWAAMQFAAYRFGLPPFWITLALALRTPGKLRELLAACDAVIIDFPFLFPPARQTSKPVALNTHNVEADLCKGTWTSRPVAAVERHAAKAVQHVFCCSESDRAYFSQLIGSTRTSVVPNGIDPGRFSGIAMNRTNLRTALGYKDGDRVLFFAASSFGPNVEALAWLEDFAARHQPLLTRKNLHFLVVGSVAKQPFERPRLKAVGMVAKVEPYFAVADLAFNCIFRGSGTNVKMAEFMAAELPILTSVSGMRGYNLEDGADCIVFTPENLATVLDSSQLLDDPAQLASMARSAYAKNKQQIDMNWCVGPVVKWLEQAG